MSAPEFTDQQLIDQFLKLRTKRDEIADEAKKKAEPFNKAMQAITGMLHDRLNKRGANHTTVDLLSVDGKATAFKTPTLQVKCSDKQAYIRFCMTDPDWGMSLLTANVSKDALADFMEKHTIEGPDGPIERVPPGIEVERGETVQIRRT